MIGLFYYLRIITVICAPESKVTSAQTSEQIVMRVASPSLAERVTLAALALLLIWLGIFPAQLIDVLEGTVANLT